MAKTFASEMYPIAEVIRMRSEMRSKRTVEEGFVVQHTDGPISLLVYEPGNGTSYKMVVTKLGNSNSGGIRSPGSYPSALALAHFGVQRGAHLVNLIHLNRSFFVNPEEYIHYLFVQDKLKCSVLDAVVIAEAVGTFLHQPFVSVDEYLHTK